MNKADMISAIKSGNKWLTNADAERCIDILLAGFRGDLMRGKPVKIHGVGTLQQVTRAEKNLRNPQTGKSMVVAEHRTVKFSVSPILKAKLNE